MQNITKEFEKCLNSKIVLLAELEKEKSDSVITFTNELNSKLELLSALEDKKSYNVIELTNKLSEAIGKGKLLFFFILPHSIDYSIMSK